MRIVLIGVFLWAAAACELVPIQPQGKSQQSGGDTVVVCHKGKKTMELPREAAQAHTGHGDRYGPC